MRLSAIDVGTNSIHTAIVEVEEDLSLKILDSAKETVHLGRGLDAKQNLTARAMTDALAVLRKAKVLCESHQVERILAVATSAIREAPNGLEFLRLVTKQTGIEVRVISGLEEGRLIYLAIRESIHLDNKMFLGVDIGGGSVEFVWGTRQEPLASDSLKLGVLRLADHFPLSNPPTRAELSEVSDYVRTHLSRLDLHARAHPSALVVGTSGTFLQLCRLALGDAFLGPSKSLHQQVVSSDALRDVCEHLARSTVKERLSLKGLDRTRIQTIVPGAILLPEILDRFAIREMVACEYALREGVLYDYVQENRSGLREERELPDIRRRSVLALARRCNWKAAHSRHIAVLSLMMFDPLATRYGWSSEERELLEYAALLHDVGMLISVPQHHRHSQYLIEHGELLGFTPREIALLGNIARYHRRSEPSKQHASYSALSKADRGVVDRLAAILRVAEGFDRTQFGLIRRVYCEVTDKLILTAIPMGDAEVEHSSAAERTRPLAKAIGMEIEVKLAPVELPDEVAGGALPAWGEPLTPSQGDFESLRNTAF